MPFEVLASSIHLERRLAAEIQATMNIRLHPPDSRSQDLLFHISIIRVKEVTLLTEGKGVQLKPQVWIEGIVRTQ